jgi:TrmH family RNA methyltransferase
VTDAVVRQWRERAGAPGAPGAPDIVLIDGFHALKHALRFGAEVPIAVAADKPAALALARELAPELTERLDALLRPVSRDALGELVPRAHPTGVAALAVRPPHVATFGTGPVVVLDNPRHLGNVGAVVRLAAGAGAGGVITTGTVDPWHPSAVRAAAGLHFATAVARLDPDEPQGRPPWSSWPSWPLYALDPAGDDIRAVTIPSRALIAFGSERAGLSPTLRARATRLLALPMRPQVSSYNLATSVAMVLFHWMSGPEGPEGPEVR